MDRPNTFQESDSAAVTARRIGRRRSNKINDGDEYKSKNLHTERRRRHKLHYRLLALRSHVPIITNMNKASIVDDAITYIRELQIKVEGLSEKLHEMEVSEVEEETDLNPKVTKDSREEMENHGIEEDVYVTKIGESKYWLKIIASKKVGVFTKFMEVMNFAGLEIIDISITTSSGAILVSSSVQRIHEGSVDVEQMRGLLMDVTRNA
ncbi:PREDICTED: transcription factor DYT1-like isoform X1 [Tarenaya hassleriana]|uniref:transcription factor DYT1-like isoform X1 n=1 Tax=Tarenaya hassleriana TaxID=28532 RepID=UPI00053C583D|nr:PREDICTED: transcription factor DYT1-like isoform X1 [Tarenaya hassleriana]